MGLLQAGAAACRILEGEGVHNQNLGEASHQVEVHIQAQEAGAGVLRSSGVLLVREEALGDPTGLLVLAEGVL